MQRKWIRILLNCSLLLALVLSSASTVFAQSDTQVRITQVDNSNFPNVTVYVSVTNSVGEPVGVDPATIPISENGEAMEIVDARGGGQGGEGVAEPLTTMLVIDISGSMDKNNKRNHDIHEGSLSLVVWRRKYGSEPRGRTGSRQG